MTIGVPRYLIIGLAALFSSYHLVLAVYSLPFGYASDPGPVVAAMVLYAIATAAVLFPAKQTRMPVWLASFSIAVGKRTRANPPVWLIEVLLASFQ